MYGPPLVCTGEVDGEESLHVGTNPGLGLDLLACLRAPVLEVSGWS
jgi:hypothetical protein